MEGGKEGERGLVFPHTNNSFVIQNIHFQSSTKKKVNLNMEGICKHLDLHIWSKKNKAGFKPVILILLVISMAGVWDNLELTHCPRNNMIELPLTCLASQTIVIQCPWQFPLTAPFQRLEVCKSLILVPFQLFCWS